VSERTLARRAAAATLLAALVPAAAAGQQLRTVTSSRQLQDERQVAVQLEYGAGHLRVSPSASDLLYRMEVRYDDQQFRPVSEYDRGSGRLKLGVESREHHGGHVRNGDQQHASIELSPRVPIDLAVQFGAGEADVELGGLALREVHLETGASRTTVSFTQPNRVAARTVKIEAGAAEIRLNGLGNTRAERFEFSGGMGEATLDFGGTWTRNATASLEMGVGSLRLRLPRGLGVKLTKDSFLTSFDASGMVKRGNAWYSRDYEQARYRLDLDINAALGSITVEWF